MFPSSQFSPLLCAAAWWWMASVSAHCTSFHPDSSENRSIQDRTHIETQICPNPFLVYLQTAASHILSFCSFFSVFLSLCDLIWKMLFASAQRTEEAGQGTTDGWKTARRAKCEGIFFFPPKSAGIQIKSYYLPPALRYCGAEWRTAEASLQRRALCEPMKAPWAGRPPASSPWRSPSHSGPAGPAGALAQSCS